MSIDRARVKAADCLNVSSRKVIVGKNYAVDLFDRHIAHALCARKPERVS